MRNTSYIFLFLIIFLLTSCEEKKATSAPLTFEQMMGKDLECWKHVVTPADFKNLSFFKEIFEENKGFLNAESSENGIPKVLHFVWLGPREFPRSSVANVNSWIEKHPGWTVKFWTDRKRNLPSELMQECIIQSPQDPLLKECYFKTDNFAERADILRYEILYLEGGVYVDHDVKCFTSFEKLNQNYDFYCGLELPADTPVSSSVHVTNNLVGSKAGHPILKRCSETLKNSWDEIERLYPGSDKVSIIRRVANRTFSAFTDSVRELACHSTRDMILPAFYFNAPSDSEAIYARHEYAGTWFQVDNPFEKMARSRLMLLSKKANQTLLLVGAAFGMNLLCLLGMFFYFRKKIVERIR